MSPTKQTTRLIACTLLAMPLITFGLSPGRAAAPQQNPAQHDRGEDADSNLLSLLDDCVQERFKEIDKGFGYRRIRSAGDTPHRFKPENAKELKIVDELNTARLNVVLYVAGRVLLGKKPDAAEILSRRLIKGPAFVSSAERPNADLPSPPQLWDQSRMAMLAFQTSDTYNFAVGKWKFSARAVRAREQSCINCHRTGVTLIRQISGIEPSEIHKQKPLRIGDPLGVVLYGYEHGVK